MGIAQSGPYAAMDDDPDDYRPGSAWLPQVDPDGRTSMAVIRERIGVGDRIPRHWHDVDEVVLYESGVAVAHLDGVDAPVSAGATVFIPAGVVHGTVNTGDVPVEVRAVYPATVVRMDLVERNPAPGTQDEPPRATRYDLTTGEFDVLGETTLPSSPDRAGPARSAVRTGSDPIGPRCWRTTCSEAHGRALHRQPTTP